MLLLPLSAVADSYAVQIGAFQTVEDAWLAPAERVGPVFTTEGPGGLTRYRVGPFASRTLAEKARETLKQLGFADAFVQLDGGAAGDRIYAGAPRSAPQGNAPSVEARAASAAAPVAEPTAAAPVTADIPAGLVNKKTSLSREEVDFLMSLTPEEREALVYLDGRLHRREGERFVPLNPR